MSTPLVLLLVITFLYAGYNLLIKVSTSHVPLESSSTILATIALQIAALSVSCIFAAGLLMRGGSSLALPSPAYMWAILAGLCIGGAEIGYFYLFRGIAGHPPFPANIAIPFIVSGTIVLTVLITWLTLKEPLSWQKIIGTILVVVGVVVLYMDSRYPTLTGT